MQVFVANESLSQIASDDVPIVAVYEDGVRVADNAHPGAQRVFVRPGDIVLGDFGRAVLRKGWRDALAESVDEEAEHRILETFPASSQRIAALKLVLAIIDYGSDPKKWPADARELLDQVRKGVSFIASMNAQADLLRNKGVGVPGANGNWPSKPDKPFKL